MREYVVFIRCVICLGMMWLLAGCATPGPRSRYLAEITPGSITNLTAYSLDHAIEIRYPLKGRDAFARASWPAPPNGNTNYGCEFSVLTFKRGSYSARKAITAKNNQLVICDAKQWKDLLHGVFVHLTPARPGHGALLLNQQMEVVLYRDMAGELKAVSLTNKPPGIVMDHTYSDEDFSQAAIKYLINTSEIKQPKQKRFLFLTDDDPAFAYVDVQKQLIVFLAYPADPEAAPVQVPGEAAFRLLNALLIKSFVITAIKNPVTLVSRGLWHLSSSGMTMADTLPPSASMSPPPLYQGPGMDVNAWEKDLDRLVIAKRHPGHAQFYVNGDEFFPALIQALENSKQSVDIMVYIFSTDDYATKVADVLRQISATRRVRVLMDDIGSLLARGTPASSAPPNFNPPGDIKAYLQSSSHVHVRVSTDPWLATDHRKCIIIDHREAFVGGMNIGWVYRYEWHDLMMGLTGPVVGRLEKDYRKAWAFSGPFGDFGYFWACLFDREHLSQYAATNDIDIRVLRTATGELQIYHAQLAAIRHAKRYIYIENAYFNDDSILRELIAARQRGVDVRVILPSENDVDIMQTGNLVMANEMIRQGIRVYLYPGMTHVKAAIYDGWACVGSANLEKMSLRVSQEMDVAFSDPKTVDELNRALFTPDFKRSTELKTPVNLNWFDPILKALGNQL